MAESTGIIESDAPVDGTAYGRENGEWVPTFAAEEMNLFVQQVNTNAQVARRAELSAKDADISAKASLTLVQQEAQNVQIARNAADQAASNANASQQQANTDAVATQQALLATQTIKTDVQTLRDSTQNAAIAASSSAAEAKHWADEAKRIADGIEPGTGGGIQYVPDTVLGTHSFTEEVVAGNFGHYRFMLDTTYTGTNDQYLSIARLPSGGDGWVMVDADIEFPVIEDGYIEGWLVLAAPEGETIISRSEIGGITDTECVYLPYAGSYRAVRINGQWRVNDAFGCDFSTLPTAPVVPPPPVEVIVWSKMGEWPGTSMPNYTHIWPGQDVGMVDTFTVSPKWRYCTTLLAVDNSDQLTAKLKIFNRNTNAWVDHSTITFDGQPAAYSVTGLYTPSALPKDRILPNNPYYDYTHGTEHYIFAIVGTTSPGDWSWGILRGKVIGYYGSYEQDPDGEYRSHTETKITWELVCTGGRNEVDDWPAHQRNLYAIAAQPTGSAATTGVVVAVGNYGLVCYSEDFGKTWVKGTADKTSQIENIGSFPAKYVPSYNAVAVSAEGLWIAVDGKLANWVMGVGTTGKPDGVRHQALQKCYSFVNLSTGIVSQPESGPTVSNPGKRLRIGDWKSVAITGTGQQTKVFMLPGSGELMLGYNPNSGEKRDILMPSTWGYPQSLKTFYNSDDLAPVCMGLLVIADKAVSKITVDTSVVSFGVTLTDVNGYPGKADNFVTCYNLSGDWHDKYAIVGTNGTFNGAYQIPMSDLVTV